MKCFMTLADRFVRRGHDPAPLADQGLMSELINLLKAAGQGRRVPGAAPPTSTHSVTTIVNLLSTLCRGSTTATHVSHIVNIKLSEFAVRQFNINSWGNTRPRNFRNNTEV